MLAYSNKEGGAHVDSMLSENIVRQSSESISGFCFSVTTSQGEQLIQKADNTPKDATVRQIAYEILSSLKREFPELL